MAQGDYLDMAIALAESIKKTQSTVNNISIIVDHDVSEHPAVDYFIKLPNDISGDAEWKVHNRASFLDLTPYNETVILDADMLFLTDVSHWWTHMSQHELLLTSQVQTYRGNRVANSPYRETFRANKLPDVYSAFTYFKRTELTKTFFDLVKSMMTDWNEWIVRYAPLVPQSWPSIDLAMAMAVSILDCEAEVTTKRNYPTFTHMKSGCQDWDRHAEDWRIHLGVYTYDKQLRLGDYRQTGVLHYVEKDFITPSIREIFT